MEGDIQTSKGHIHDCLSPPVVSMRKLILFALKSLFDRFSAAPSKYDAVDLQEMLNTIGVTFHWKPKRLKIRLRLDRHTRRLLLCQNSGKMRLSREKRIRRSLRALETTYLS